MRRVAHSSRWAKSAASRVDVDVGEVAGGRARPCRAGQVGRLRVEFELACRLVVAQPQAGRAAEIRRVDDVLGEAEEQAALGVGAVQLGAEVADEAVEDGRRGLVRRLLPRARRRQPNRTASRAGPRLAPACCHAPPPPPPAPGRRDRRPGLRCATPRRLPCLRRRSRWRPPSAGAHA